MSQQQQKESETEKGGMGILDLVTGFKRSQKQQGKQSGFSNAQLKKKSFKSLSQQQQLAIVKQLAIQEYKSISGKKTNAGFKAYLKRNMKSLVARANAEFMSGKLGMEVDEGVQRQKDLLKQNKLDIQQMETYRKRMSEAKEKLDGKLVDYAEAADKYGRQTQDLNMQAASLFANIAGNSIQQAANLQRQEGNRHAQGANLLTRTGQVQSAMQHAQTQQNFLTEQQNYFQRHDEMQAANAAQNEAYTRQIQKNRESREAIARQEAQQRKELQAEEAERQQQLAALQREQTAAEGQASRETTTAAAEALAAAMGEQGQVLGAAINAQGQAIGSAIGEQGQALGAAINAQGQATRATLEAGFEGLSGEMAKLAAQFGNMNADFKAQIDALIQQGKDNTAAMEAAIERAMDQQKEREAAAREIIATMSEPCIAQFNWFYACHIYGTVFPQINDRPQLIFVCAGGSGNHWFNGDPDFKGSNVDRTWNASRANDGENGAGEFRRRPAWAKTTSGTIPQRRRGTNDFQSLLLPGQQLKTTSSTRGEIVGPSIEDCYTVS